MSWGGGYVTDVAYAAGYYAEQSPRMMAIAALVNGYRAELPGRQQAYHFVDIGCGRGYSALVLAATNPGWQVTGLDFNPAHVAGARALAARAGIGNVRFIEADFTRFGGEALADFDAASLHGVWTWVAPAVRQGILRLLEAKLKPGGLCHVSYNVLPAWRGMIGLQRLMREAGVRLGHRADRQAARGFAVIRRLAEAGGAAIDPMARTIIEHCADKPASYLAHEFMNEAWVPCFHQDVAAAFGAVKMQYVGSPRLLENFPTLILDDTARAIAGEFEDPEMLELLKDVTMNQPLRHDVFMRGAIRLDPAARQAAIGAVRLGLAVPYARRRLEFQAPVGRATMSEGLYEPAFSRLEAGSAPVEALLEAARLASPDVAIDNPGEVVAMLIGTGQAVLVAEEGAPMDAPSVRLNAAMFAEKMRSGPLTQPLALAVPALGGGYGLPGISAFAVLRQQDWLSEATVGTALPRPGPAEFAAWAEMAIPDGDAADRERVVAAFAAFFEHEAATVARLGLTC